MKINRLTTRNMLSELYKHDSINNKNKQNNEQLNNQQDTFVNNYKNTSIIDVKVAPLKAENNKLIIKECFLLGTFNGKEINMRIFENGGFETTNCPNVPRSPAGSKVTPEQKRIAEIYDSFGPREHEEISKTAYLINVLSRTSNKDENEGVETLNELIKNYPQGKINVRKNLFNLGIDYNKIFTINGRSFTLNNNDEFVLYN